MKRILLLPFLLLLGGCQGNPTQWPTSWRQFDPPPSKKVRPLLTVKFSQSIEDACKEFEKADKLENLFKKKWDTIVDPLVTKFRLGTLTKEEYKERLKEATPVYEALWPREIKTVSTAVEVLRQAKYPDWKLYSRYNSSGIGDLLMQEENMIVSPNMRYTLAKSEARSVCDKFRL